jgi:hypothetical protein
LKIQLALLSLVILVFMFHTAPANAAPVGRKLPFASNTGTWKVLSGYNNGGEHVRANQYDLDLQRNSGSTASLKVLSPVSGMIVSRAFVCRTNGQRAGFGVNIRVDNAFVSGVASLKNYLFVQIWHLDSQPAVGHVNIGQVLGTIYDSGLTSPHVHIGLFSANYSSANWTRASVPFSGDYSLDGYSFPATSAQNAYRSEELSPQFAICHLAMWKPAKVAHL